MLQFFYKSSVDFASSVLKSKSKSESHRDPGCSTDKPEPDPPEYDLRQAP